MAKLLFYFFILFVAVNLCFAIEERCKTPLDGGLCYGNEDKYGYNTATGACEFFAYGGCGGNDNKFDTLDECKSVCGN